MKLLLVENDAATRLLLRQVMQARGHDVHECPTAEAGWAAFLDGDFDVVLTNRVLPGMSGADLCRDIRNDSRGGRCLILAVTDGTDPAALREAVAAGADDCIAKPLDIELLNIRMQIAEARADERIAGAQAEERYERIEEKLRHSQKLECLGVLAGGIAHDFNNLLVGIMGNAGLAMMDLTETSPLRQPLEQIELTAKRASELTAQMLAYSGRGRFKVEPTNLNALARDMTSLLNISIAKTAKLRLELDDTVTSVDADATQLRQVMMNLITNASDALGGDVGEITLRTGSVRIGIAETEDLVIPAGLAPGEYSFFEVSDTGCGMDRDAMSRIFDPFFTTKTNGRGLGLAAVNGIVRAHHGGIQVDSRPGEGTTIRFLLPASGSSARDDCAQPLIAGDRDAAQPDRATILVVDRDEGVQTVTKVLIDKLGFRPLTAGSVDDGLARFREHAGEIGAVFLDHATAGDDPEVLRRFEQLDDAVPVVLCSPLSDEEAERRFGGLGYHDFLEKPFLPAAFHGKLQRALPAAPALPHRAPLRLLSTS